jgi:L-cysteine:1D-myo-inositol 2-amino-2-deoxy-alpha-D-glucopyranoside ligase
MLQLARERGGNPGDPNKGDPLDFVLWQPSAPGEPAWDSLWGRGRPGWHIECSALAVRELGVTIDLHGGGSDLIFPHHECEAAQSEAATGELFVRHWAHAGMVRYEGTKMSKSLGNLVFVRDLLETWEPAVIRLAVLAHHYRSDWDWHEGLLSQAADRLALWRKHVDAEGLSGPGRSGPEPGLGLSGPERSGPGEPGAGGGGVLDEVRAALDDDLSTPRALTAIDAAASDTVGESSRGELVEAAALLGVQF